MLWFLTRCPPQPALGCAAVPPPHPPGGPELAQPTLNGILNLLLVGGSPPFQALHSSPNLPVHHHDGWGTSNCPPPPPPPRQEGKEARRGHGRGGLEGFSTSPPRRGWERVAGAGGTGTRYVQDKKRSLLGTGLISGEGGGEGEGRGGGGGPLGHDNDCRTLATARRSAPRRRLPRPGGLSKLL